MSKQPRVPAMTRRHEWVVIGSFEIPLDDHEVGRITADPDDIGVNWRQRARLVRAVGPGCQVCGGMAADVQGKPCPGGDQLEQAMASQAVRDRIWTPES